MLESGGGNVHGNKHPIKTNVRSFKATVGERDEGVMEENEVISSGLIKGDDTESGKIYSRMFQKVLCSLGGDILDVRSQGHKKCIYTKNDEFIIYTQRQIQHTQVLSLRNVHQKTMV